ncbi:MAG: ABC transporter permease subunit [Chloroflexi bacterium]|nr:ABC transporter permease subunit [Chloroflexota bacterium]
MVAVELPRRALGQAVGLLVVPLVLLALWQLLAMLLGSFYLATPAETFTAIVNGLRDGPLGQDLLVTLQEVALGYAIAAVAGLWIGLLLGLNRFWAAAYEPIFLTIYSIPKVTLFPIFLFFFGLGVNSKIAFGAFHAVFPIILFSLEATRTVPRPLQKLSRQLGLSPWATFRLIVLPWAAPSIVAGLRIGFSLAYLGVILGEMFASRAGSGYRLIQLAIAHHLPEMFAIITVLVVIALVGNGLLLGWEHLLLRHRRQGSARLF